MTAPSASLRGRSQEGVTLVETLAVLAISSIIMIPLLGWAVLAIQEQEAALNRNVDGASIGLLRTYFVRDVASANGAATGAAAEGTDCSGGAGAATAPAQTLLHLERDGGEYVVYNEVTSSGGVGLSIWRRECDGPTLMATTEVMDRVLDWLQGFPEIAHDPLGDTEDTEHPYEVTALITSEISRQSSSVNGATLHGARFPSRRWMRPSRRRR